MFHVSSSLGSRSTYSANIMKEKKRKKKDSKESLEDNIKHQHEDKEIHFHNLDDVGNTNICNPLPDEIKQTNILEEEPNTAHDMDVSQLKKRKRKKKKQSSGTHEPEINLEMLNDAEKLKDTDYTVYIDGLPFDCSEDQVQEFFHSHGCTDVLEMRLPKWQDSGRLRGYGHVVFRSKESCKKAIQEVHRKTLKTRYINIEPANAPRNSSIVSTKKQPVQPKGCKTIFVKNLPYEDCLENDIEKIFSVYGKIVEGGVRLVRNSQTKQSKGFAYVEFKNPEGALAAVSQACQKGIVFQDRLCLVDYDEGRVRDSYRTAGGALWKKEFSSSLQKLQQKSIRHGSK